MIGPNREAQLCGNCPINDLFGGEITLNQNAFLEVEPDTVTIYDQDDAPTKPIALGGEFFTPELSIEDSEKLEKHLYLAIVRRVKGCTQGVANLEPLSGCPALDKDVLALKMERLFTKLGIERPS